MGNYMEATVAVGRCMKSERLFGVRLEKRKNLWVYNWAFKLSEKVALHEGYNFTEIKGIVAMDGEYPGCPYCETKSLIVCSCGHLNCYDGTSRYVTCSWCGLSGEVGNGPIRLQSTGNY